MVFSGKEKQSTSLVLLCTKRGDCLHRLPILSLSKMIVKTIPQSPLRGASSLYTREPLCYGYAPRQPLCCGRLFCGEKFPPCEDHCVAPKGLLAKRKSYYPPRFATRIQHKGTVGKAQTLLASPQQREVARPSAAIVSEELSLLSF